MSIVRKILLSWLLLTSVSCYAQSDYVDSLSLLIRKAKTDEIRVDKLIKLSRYYYDFDLEKADSTIRIAINISDKIGYKLGSAIAYDRLGMTVRKLGFYDEGIEHLKHAIDICVEENDSIGISIGYNNLGILYDELGKYELSLENYLRSNKIDRLLGDKKGIAYSLNNLSLIHSYMEQYDQAIISLNESIEIKKELGDEKGLAHAYLNLANMYNAKEDYSKTEEIYYQALEYFQKSGVLSGEAKCYNNLGILYKNLKDYDKALENFLIGHKIRIELGDEMEIAKSKHSIGELYIKLKMYDEALFMLQESARLCKKLHGVETLKRAYGSLHILYSEINDYENAYQYSLLFQSIKDSIMDGSKYGTLSELQTKYETEKNQYEKEIAEAGLAKNMEKTKRVEADSQRKSILLYAAVFGFILVMGLVVVTYRSYRLKRKANDELQTKNDIIKQKNEDITASIQYAKHIQDSILPSHDTIKKILPNNFVMFKPRDIVSGDFYWVHKEGETTFFAAADCTGHGVPGALVSMVCSNAINHVVVQDREFDADRILTRLNQEVIERLRKEESINQAVDGMDISLCKIENKDGKIILEYAGAMNSLYVCDGGEDVQEVRADRYSIGGRTPLDYQFSKHSIELQKGNRVFVFSDGMIDQFGGPKGKKLLSKRFKKLLLKYSETPIHKLEKLMAKEFTEWQGGYKQTDDVLVIGIEV